jgi:hypothetical protein
MRATGSAGRALKLLGSPITGSGNPCRAHVRQVALGVLGMMCERRRGLERDAQLLQAQRPFDAQEWNCGSSFSSRSSLKPRAKSIAR